MDETPDDRRKALEEQFFKKENEKLVKQLQEANKRKATKAELARLTGITNDALLDALAALNLGPAAMVLMSVLPLTEVAWADGSIDVKERKAVLEQAHAMGIGDGTEASLVLAGWLDEKPDETWAQLWTDYVKELAKKLSDADKAQLKTEVVGRARLVAEASGKTLGLGSGISKAEQRVLDRLEQSFR